MLPSTVLHQTPRQAVALELQAQRLHRLGYLPCRPELALDQALRPLLSCRWRGPVPPGLARVPATTLVRGAFIAWRHATADGLVPAAGAAPFPYAWVAVSQNNPAEALTIWQYDRASDRWSVALRTLANTGTRQTTKDGSWPIYWRFRTTQMQGVTPSGRPYRLSAVPWVNYYHGNDAIHGFTRAMYGFPQSAGCVELPLPAARTAYRLLHDGAVVTVSGRWCWRAGYAPAAAIGTAWPRQPVTGPGLGAR